MPRQDINAVLRAHEDELMAIPGVVGVYVGLMDNDKTPCLKVMVVKKTKDLEQQIPKSLEGYPVVIEETGVIRPLRKSGKPVMAPSQSNCQNSPSLPFSKGGRVGGDRGD